MKIVLITLLIVIVFIVILKKTKRKIQKEDYTLLPSISGTEWFLGRRMNWHIEHPDNPDSKPFLEGLGFRILGRADEMRYGVEPPLGWKIINYGERLHSYVIDQSGKPKFWVFEKQEFHDFRAYIYISEEMNSRVLKKHA